MPILRKKDTQKAKNANIKFFIDFTEPKADKVINLDEYVSFLQTKIKVNGKTGALGQDITLNVEGDAKVVLASSIPFSKRYLKYLTKKYLKQESLRDYLYVSAVSKDTYKVKYFDIAQDEAEK